MLLRWHGDMREGPFFSPLPAIWGAPIVVGWKQDDNGTTFWGSEHRLGWLEEEDDTEWRVRDPFDIASCGKPIDLESLRLEAAAEAMDLEALRRKAAAEAVAEMLKYAEPYLKLIK